MRRNEANVFYYTPELNALRESAESIRWWSGSAHSLSVHGSSVKTKYKGGAMRVSVTSCAGRADPLGLLVLAVIMALTVTIGIQAQASAPDGQVELRSQMTCSQPCITGDRRH